MRRSRIVLGTFAIAFVVAVLFIFVQTQSVQGSPVIDRVIQVRSVSVVALERSDSRPLTGRPRRLQIPTLKIDTLLESVGLASDGRLGVPHDITKAAWFELGPRPGENGTAVMNGHFGWKDNVPSVFDRLHKLRPGDIVFVLDEYGKRTTFVVRRSQRYSPDAETADIFGSTDGESHLNLITCDGEWDEITKSYPDRLVVFTDKVPE